MKNIFLSILILFLYNTLLFGQNGKIDSLISVLKNAKEDTNKVNTLLILSKQLKIIGNYDISLTHVDNAKRLAEKLNFIKGIAKCQHSIGNIYQLQGNYPEALEKYYAALKLSEKIGDKIGICDVHSSLGITYSLQGNYSKALIEQLYALKQREEIRDTTGIAVSCSNLGNIYFSQGNYPDAMREFLTALKIWENLGDKKSVADTRSNLGNIFIVLGNYREGLKEYFAALKFSSEIGDKRGIGLSHGNIGNVYFTQGKYHEALKEIVLSLSFLKEIGDMQGCGMCHSYIGDIYKSQGKYLDAVNEYTASLRCSEKLGDEEGVMYGYINLGILNIKFHNFSTSKKYLYDALSFAKRMQNSDALKDCWKGLAMLDSATANWVSAYEHYKLYVTYRDSLFNEENTKKLVQTQMQYDFDKKEAATKAETDKKDALAKAEIGKQKIIRNSIAGGTCILVISSIFSFLVYKRKREATFKNEVSEVEMKALRSQMNPHFIFNSLNSIKRYMANHDNKTAEDYLMKFASVMRMILENSEHKEVPLQQDLKALELYMQLESLRMKKKFVYEIKVDESIDQENTLIPPLILQPFVENSIWHGLAGKEGEGKIAISINRVGEMIECIVEDNGVGRQKAKTNNPEIVSIEKKSLGMKITKARIDILNKIKKSKAGVELVDLAEGMKVIVKLPLELSF